MFVRLFLMFAVLIYCVFVYSDCVFVYSSFWAPLFNPKILNYRVDIPFNPDAGKNAREEYAKKYGVRGEKLIADLGNGKGPSSENKNFEDIQFYYTYPGANVKNKRK